MRGRKKINIIQISTKLEQANFGGPGLSDHEWSQKFVWENLLWGEEIVLLVYAEGRKPRCYKCGKKGHLKSKCSPPQKEKAQENKPEEVYFPGHRDCYSESDHWTGETGWKDTVIGREGIPNGVTKKVQEANGLPKQRGGSKKKKKKKQEEFGWRK